MPPSLTENGAVNQRQEYSDCILLDASSKAYVVYPKIILATCLQFESRMKSQKSIVRTPTRQLTTVEQIISDECGAIR